MSTYQRFTPNQGSGELKSGDGRTLDEWRHVGFEVQAYLPGNPGTDDVMVVLSNSRKAAIAAADAASGADVSGGAS